MSRESIIEFEDQSALEHRGIRSQIFQMGNKEKKNKKNPQTSEFKRGSVNSRVWPFSVNQKKLLFFQRLGGISQ